MALAARWGGFPSLQLACVFPLRPTWDFLLFFTVCGSRIGRWVVVLPFAVLCTSTPCSPFIGVTGLSLCTIEY